MYLLSVTRAGRTIEIEKYYTYRFGPKGGKRGKRRRPMTEVQRRANNRQAERKLRRLVNANFGPGDLHVVLSYARKKGEPYRTREEMRKDADSFLRNLRKAFRKAGMVLKYIHVMEVGEKGARHHHLIISHIDSRIIQACWGGLGRVLISPLDGSGQYRKLAEYLVKYSNRTVGTDAALMGKRWSCSRNLTRPEPERTVVSERKFFRSEAKVPAALAGKYYVDQETVEKGVYGDGYGYFRYTLVEYGTGNGAGRENRLMGRRQGAGGRRPVRHAERSRDGKDKEQVAEGKGGSGGKEGRGL